MVLEVLLHSPLNHLMQLLAQGNFINIKEHCFCNAQLLPKITNSMLVTTSFKDQTQRIGEKASSSPGLDKYDETGFKGKKAGNPLKQEPKSVTHTILYLSRLERPSLFNQACVYTNLAAFTSCLSLSFHANVGTESTLPFFKQFYEITMLCVWVCLFQHSNQLTKVHKT